jgi:AraC family transcriptional regulator of adaptative response/methylated-DNA-[protein]-cysteine methyltransferase
MTMPSEPEMRAAIAARDKACDGHFFFGVVTTGVFCRPSCAARPARPENLRFFPGVESALAAGFRPCKRCRPMEITPDLNKLVEIARYIESHADERLTLGKLAKEADLSPSRFQRVFKAAFGVSPKAYQDSVRMKRFKLALKEGHDVTDAIFSAGFGSVSRVYGEQVRSAP